MILDLAIKSAHFFKYLLSSDIDIFLGRYLLLAKYGFGHLVLLKDKFKCRVGLSDRFQSGFPVPAPAKPWADRYKIEEETSWTFLDAAWHEQTSTIVRASRKCDRLMSAARTYVLTQWKSSYNVYRPFDLTLFLKTD